MTIKFLHMPLEIIDQLCNEEETVKVVISIYSQTTAAAKEMYNDATSEEEEQLIGSFGCTIKSSKDLIQFDNEDMKQLSKHTKKSLR